MNRLRKEDPYHDEHSGRFTTGPGGAATAADAKTPMGTVRGDGKRLEWGPDGSKVWVQRGPKDYGGPKQSASKRYTGTNIVFLKGRPQYNRLGKSKIYAVDHILTQAKKAVQPLLDAIGNLNPVEREAVARALINAAKPHLTLGKAYNPDEPRNPAGSSGGGQWTAGGVAAAGARMAGRGALALGGMTLRGLQDALSTVALIPSSKSSVSQALKEWWPRASSRDENVASSARIEAMGRVLGTIFVGIGIYAVAQYYLPIAANSIGLGVSRMIGHALNLGVP